MDKFTCKCGERRRTEFYLRPSGNPRGECKACEKRRATTWIERNRLRHNENIRRAANARGAYWPDKLRRHGLTQQDYEEALTRQRGRCDICDTENPGKGRVHFCIDHDHAHCPGLQGCKECFRGLLCNRCNRILGLAYDDPGIFAAAAAYLGVHHG